MNKYGQKVIQLAIVVLGIWAALEIFKSVELAEEVDNAVNFAWSPQLSSPYFT